MPRIIQIIFDDAGWGDFPGRTLNSNQLTPNLDTLAAASRRFTRFYVASPVCSASRVAFCTGKLPQYSDVHYVDAPNLDYRQWLPKGSLTDTQIAKAIGWSTGFFGKWHMGTPPQTTLPIRHGYDRAICTPVGTPTSMFPGYEDYTDAWHLDDEPPSVQIAGFADDVYIDQAIAYVTAHAADDFLVKIWTCSPHEPITTVNPELSTYFSAGGTLAERQFAAMMRRCDSKLGELFAEMVTLGIWDDTYVFVTSDNGPEGNFGEPGSSGGLRGYKATLWEGGLRVPAILHGPGITASVDATPRWALDWLPTVLEIMGGSAPSYEGTSLLDTPPDRVFTWEYNSSQDHPVPAEASGTFAVLRTVDDRKILSDVAGDPLEMYDITADPEETTDLSVSEAATFTEMSALLAAAVAAIPAENVAAHDINTANPSTLAQALEIVEGTNVTYGLEPALPRTRLIMSAGTRLVWAV